MSCRNLRLIISRRRESGELDARGTIAGSNSIRELPLLGVRASISRRTDKRDLESIEVGAGKDDKNKLSDSVKGRNVVLEKKFGAPTITNDGVTDAKGVEPSEKDKKVKK